MAKQKKGNDTITKTMKYQIFYRSGYKERTFAMQTLFDTAKMVREIKNKTIQICYRWDADSLEHYEATGEYLNLRQEKDCGDLSTLAYRQLGPKYSALSSGVLAAATRTAYQKYNNDRKDVLVGAKSIASFRSDQPIPIRKQNFSLGKSEDGQVIMSLNLLSKNRKKELDLDDSLIFDVSIHDGTQAAIMERCLDGTYKAGDSQIEYNRNKNKWFLSLVYTAPKQAHTLDAEKILGVDLGIKYVICASSYGNNDFFQISGDEVDEKERRISALEYAAALEEKKKELQHQAAHCGDGRRGHGTKTRVKSVYKARNKIANYKDTLNHRYSRDLVNFAVSHGYGTIQMEDLSGIKTENKRLRHWTYYDLQQKITYKAEEAGIVVEKIDPRYTSQRCSQCGYIDSENRPTQEVFHCLKCGMKRNADWNASQNISIRNISKIIDKERKKMEKEREKAAKAAKPTSYSSKKSAKN